MVEATNERFPHALRQMRGASGDMRRFVAVPACSEQFDRSDDHTQPVPTASNSAARVNLRPDQVETFMAALAAWTETAEDLQRRVTHLEQAR